MTHFVRLRKGSRRAARRRLAARRVRPEASQPTRARCYRCFRPEAFCLCALIPRLPTRSRLVLLQHPREEFVAIGTARLAALSVEGATRHVGVTFDDDREVQELAARPDACLLFPSDDATPVEALRGQARTLFVVDGTWWQAQKLLSRNPGLAALPRVAFTPAAPSRYRIRKEPSAECVSTIEAIAHVLSVLDDDERFSAMLAPFDALIDAQVRFKHEVRASRHAKRTRRVPRAIAEIADVWDRLVCVAGDANAWPYRGLTESPDELVSFVAERVATGERVGMVVRPTHALAPLTARHTGIPEAELLAGASPQQLAARLAGFFRADDVVAAWGFYALGRARACGVALPEALIDLRRVTTVALGRKVGHVVDVPGAAGFEAPRIEGMRRAEQRLALSVATARWLRERALAGVAT